MSGSVAYRHKIFIENYLKTWNATESAKQAGYSHPDVQGCRLLGYAKIQEAIKKRLEEATMSADEVLVRLAEQARMNISDFLVVKENPNGEKGLAHLDWDAIIKKGYLIKSITPTTSGLKLELHDGQAALLAIAKHHGLLVEKEEGNYKLEILVKYADQTDRDNTQETP